MTDRKTPQDWLAAGYTRHENNPHMAERGDFFLLKRIYDEDGRIRYFINVTVTDMDKIAGAKIPYRWGFTPRVQFTRAVTMNVELFTDDPAVAEAEFHALWESLGRPYYD